MKTIQLDKRAEGEKLAQDVQNKAGQLLVASGTILTDAIIGQLTSRGVSSVSVESGDDDNPSRTYSEEEVRQITDECREALAQRFYKQPDDVMSQALFDAVLDDMVAGKLQ